MPSTVGRPRRRATLVAWASRAGAARALVAVGLLAAVAGATDARSDAPPSPPPLTAVPTAHCGPGSLPETEQGRAPADDFTSGRAAKGYLCNTREVSHFGQTAGLKVFRYVDPAGHVCAFYDTTTMFPTDAPRNLGKDGLGVVVLDMSDPANPKKAANLTSPAMLTPHESLVLSPKRGLLVAVAGNAVTYPGLVDVYDVKQDCRAPKLLSETPLGLLGHESAMSPDGRTFFASSTLAETVAAVDLTDPSNPQPLWYEPGTVYHGMTVSDDGTRLYAARIGQPPTFEGGIEIRDITQIKERKLNPQVPVISSLTWPSHSTPQIPIPVTIKGHKYLIEADEFATPADEVGAARIINIDDEKNPYIVSNIRLAVNQPENRAAEANDPGASNNTFGGYSAHYCAVPQRDNPALVACSFILSGLRIFDIRDPEHPREVAYFNKPPSGGSGALAAPAWDVSQGQVWYSDTKSGFYAVKLTNGVASLLNRKFR
jgi:hypothetical protein